MKINRNDIKLITYILIIGFVIGFITEFSIVKFTTKKKENSTIVKINNIEQNISKIIVTTIINETKRREGFSAKRYFYNNWWYIGYGCQLSPNDETETITEPNALYLLSEEYYNNVKMVEEVFKITDNRKYSIASLAYTIGFTKVMNTNLIKMIKEGKPDSLIAEEFLKFNKIRYGDKYVTSTNLNYTRQIEKQMYLLGAL